MSFYYIFNSWHVYEVVSSLFVSVRRKKNIYKKIYMWSDSRIHIDVISEKYYNLFIEMLYDNLLFGKVCISNKKSRQKMYLYMSIYLNL